MQRKRELDDDCSHRNQITDYSSGTEVCTDCGLVIENQIFTYSEAGNCSFSCKENSSKSFYASQNFHLQLGVETIHDVCSTHHISNVICKTACQLLFDQEKNIKPTNMLCVAAHCLLEASKKHQAPRTDQEICYMFKVPPKSLYRRGKRQEEQEVLQIDETKPSDIMPRINFPFQLLYSQRMKLAKRADALFSVVDACPKTCLAYIIYDKYGQKKDGPLKLSMCKVAKMCHVSPTSIKRLKKRLV